MTVSCRSKSDLPQAQRGKRCRLRTGRDYCLLRRQELPLQPLCRPLQQRRRGHHSRAVLGQLSRHGRTGQGVTGLCQTKEENGFRITPKELSAAISPSTKALFLNNPCNPTGGAYTKDELLEIAKIAVDEGIVVISDEIYEKLIYDGFNFTCFASLGKKIKEQTITHQRHVQGLRHDRLASRLRRRAERGHHAACRKSSRTAHPTPARFRRWRRSRP